MKYRTEKGKEIVPENPPEPMPEIIRSPELASQNANPSPSGLSAEDVRKVVQEEIAKKPAESVAVAVAAPEPEKPANSIREIKPITEPQTPPENPQPVATDAPPPPPPKESKPDASGIRGNVFKKLLLG